MSEPNSLYLRVTLTEDRYGAFMRSPLVAPRQFDDWLPWLKTRQFHGTITTEEIEAITQPTAADLTRLANTPGAPPLTTALTDPVTVGDYVIVTVQSPYCAPSRSHYDAVSNTWTLIVAQYSENYYDYLEILSILRAVATYKDLPGEDFILIFPYLWGGGEPDVTLTIEQGQSHLVTTTSGHMVEEANLALGTLLADTNYGGEAHDDL